MTDRSYIDYTLDALEKERKRKRRDRQWRVGLSIFWGAFAVLKFIDFSYSGSGWDLVAGVVFALNVLIQIFLAFWVDKPKKKR